MREIMAGICSIVSRFLLLLIHIVTLRCKCAQKSRPRWSRAWCSVGGDVLDAPRTRSSARASPLWHDELQKAFLREEGVAASDGRRTRIHRFKSVHPSGQPCRFARSSPSVACAQSACRYLPPGGEPFCVVAPCKQGYQTLHISTIVGTHPPS